MLSFCWLIGAYFFPVSSHKRGCRLCIIMVYTLLMNYSYETFNGYWAESLLLVHISMMYYESAPKIMSCNEKLGFIGQSDAFLWLI